ncbi:MAG: hypothetical protein V4438_02220 [Patescibacteria group bacterium]
MEIDPTLETLLNDRDHEIRVLLTNVESDDDKLILRGFGLRESEIDGDKTFVGNLKPSVINFMRGIGMTGTQVKISIDRAVPRSQH